MNTIEKIPHYNFDEHCGFCKHYKTASCKFKDINESLTRWKTLGCNDYKMN